MNKTLACVTSFILGVVVGVVVTKKLSKDEYEIIEAETYTNDEADEPISEEEEDNYADISVKERKETVSAYKNLVNDLNYGPTKQNKEEGESEEDIDGPYVISPDDFGEYWDYSNVSLHYYEDGVIADDFLNVMEEDDIEDTIGNDAVNHFGQYEDDAVYVRNDMLKTDYELLKEIGKFSDINENHFANDG